MSIKICIFLQLFFAPQIELICGACPPMRLRSERFMIISAADHNSGLPLILYYTD